MGGEGTRHFSNELTMGEMKELRRQYAEGNGEWVYTFKFRSKPFRRAIPHRTQRTPARTVWG